jgi:hypothetical protein
MRFRKLVLAVSLLQVCFMLAVQSAKADTILIDDNSAEGVITVTDIGGADTVTGSPCLETATTCQFNITRVDPATGGNLTPSFFGFFSSWLLAESATTTVPGTPESDSLNSSISGTQVQLHFNSDVPTPDNPLGQCPLINGGGGAGCNDVENGTASTVTGLILWGTSTNNPDTVQVFSDIATPSAVPEPSSLILLGSGLAIAGGFLRRRRRVVTPSVVA